ncbi:MAG: hypothetical protein ACJ73S_06290 [Mycobacteriales bacterium]
MVRQALDAAGTTVCEPMARVRVDVPTTALGPLVSALGRLAAMLAAQVPDGDGVTVEAVLPAARVADLQRRLPALTGGEGVLDSTYAGHAPVPGRAPVRPRPTAS